MACSAISDNVRDAFCLCEFVLRHVLGQVMAAQSNSDNGIGVQALESYRVSNYRELHPFRP